MNNFLTFIFNILLAGIDPFLPAGSVLIASFAILGTERKGSWILISLIAAGTMRDVLMVQRLGTSNLVLSLCWIISALGINKFDKLVPVSLTSVAVGTILISLIEQRNIGINVLCTAVYMLILLFLYQITSAGLQDKIKLKGN